MWPTSEIIIEYENVVMKSFLKENVCKHSAIKQSIRK